MFLAQIGNLAEIAIADADDGSKVQRHRSEGVIDMQLWYYTSSYWKLSRRLDICAAFYTLMHIQSVSQEAVLSAGTIVRHMPYVS